MSLAASASSARRRRTVTLEFMAAEMVTRLTADARCLLAHWGGPVDPRRAAEGKPHVAAGEDPG